MTAAIYPQLKIYYNQLLQDQASPDETQERIIGYLNRTVKANEEAQPAPFTATYINTFCNKLKDQATKEKATLISEAIDQWKNSWFDSKYERKTEGPFVQKMHKLTPPSTPQSPLEELFSDTLEISPPSAKEKPQTLTQESIKALLSNGTDHFIKEIRGPQEKKLQNTLANWNGKNGERICHLASQLGTPEILGYLSSIGASLGSTDRDNRNCMHYAVSAGNIATIEYLFRSGHWNLLDQADKKGFTPMQEAILNGSHESFIKIFVKSIQSLRSKQFPDGENEFHVAAKSGFLPVFSFYTLSNILQYITGNSNHSGQTPLELAVLNGHLGVVRLIYSHGRISKKVITQSLSLAEANNQKVILEYLTTGKVENAPTYEDLKAHPEKMTELINNGLDINGLQNGKTMLHRAIDDDDLELVKRMIFEGGALITVKAACDKPDIVAESGRGLPAFYYAAFIGRPRIVEFLNETFYANDRAFRTFLNHHGDPIRLADKYGHGKKIRDVLLNRGWSA